MLRIWGRVPDPTPTDPTHKKWIKIETTKEGYNDWVYLTNLVQVLKLNLNESPFYGDWGIPAKPSVVQQVFPDYYVTLTQQRFASRFASLIVSKNPPTNQPGDTPVYNINAVTNYGVRITADTQVPV